MASLLHILFLTFLTLSRYMTQQDKGVCQAVDARLCVCRRTEQREQISYVELLYGKGIL